MFTVHKFAKLYEVRHASGVVVAVEAKFRAALRACRRFNLDARKGAEFVPCFLRPQA
jgi:hypothetical protein